MSGRCVGEGSGVALSYQNQRDLRGTESGQEVVKRERKGREMKEAWREGGRGRRRRRWLLGDVLGGRALTFPRRASRPSRNSFSLGLVPQNDNNARFLFPIVSSPAPSMRPEPLAKTRHKYFQTKRRSTGEQRPTGTIHILRAVFLSSNKTTAFLIHCARRCPSHPVLQLYTYRRYGPH